MLQYPVRCKYCRDRIFVSFLQARKIRRAHEMRLRQQLHHRDDATNVDK
jgi:hypothetical protein